MSHAASDRILSESNSVVRGLSGAPISAAPHGRSDPTARGLAVGPGFKREEHRRRRGGRRWPVSGSSLARRRTGRTNWARWPPRRRRGVNRAEPASLQRLTGPYPVLPAAQSRAVGPSPPPPLRRGRSLNPKALNPFTPQYWARTVTIENWIPSLLYRKHWCMCIYLLMNVFTHIAIKFFF